MQDQTYLGCLLLLWLPIMQHDHSPGINLSRKKLFTWEAQLKSSSQATSNIIPATANIELLAVLGL